VHYHRVVIDEATDAGSRAAARLRGDLVAWLVTVSPDGTPVPTPIWFLWDDGTILLYSQPGKPKLRHIAANPRVAVALRTDSHGDDLAVITGEAAVDDSAPAADASAAYLAKYDAEITRQGYEPASFASEYSVAIRITPTRLRAW
jgi:PPOX class probable F420-dependent enzyme